VLPMSLCGRRSSKRGCCIEEGNRAAQETAVKFMRELAARLGLFHTELEVVPGERPGLPEPANEQELDAAIEEVEPDQ